MIAFIRARFPNTPASQEWSDAVAANWMNPAIPFSVAHYWKQSTFQQVDVSCVVFPPVVVNDPRQNKSDDRDQLVRAVLVAVDQSAHPNWDQFDRCIIGFAQPTDLFGGGTHKAPNGKQIEAAVFDLASGFDQACQEVGHTFGLQHELGAWYYDSYGNYTNEYGCPYSVMSAASDFSFDREPNPNLPGVQGPTDPQRIIGPYVPTAHLYINQYRAVNPAGAFNHPDSVSYLSTTYESSPVSERLHARDVAIAAWPARRTVLVVVPPIVAGGDTHFLELRRKDGSYDNGIGNASIIILATNFFVRNGAVQDPSTLRLRYVDRIDLEGAGGDLDYHSFNGRFVVRVSGSAPGFASVNLTIGGGNAWQDFRLTLDDSITSSVPGTTGPWTPAVVAPCPIEAKREFEYRVNTSQTFVVLQARSAGYETPGYTWKIEGQVLDPAGNSLSLQVSCRDNAGPVMNSVAVHTVACTYKVDRGRLELSVASPFADIVLGIEVVVAETSPSVMKNFYPDRTLWTSVHADNLSIEWDAEFQAASNDCWNRLRGVSTRFQEVHVTLPGLGSPDPPDLGQVDVGEVIRVLLERDPQAARAVAGVVADRATVSTDEVIEAARRTARDLNLAFRVQARHTLRSRRVHTSARIRRSTSSSGPQTRRLPSSHAGSGGVLERSHRPTTARGRSADRGHPGGPG